MQTGKAVLPDLVAQAPLRGGLRRLRGVEISGGVAQLGERELCKLEVIGSIPFTSTNLCFFQTFSGT